MRTRGFPIQLRKFYPSMADGIINIYKQKEPPYIPIKKKFKAMDKKYHKMNIECQISL